MEVCLCISFQFLYTCLLVLFLSNHGPPLCYVHQPLYGGESERKRQKLHNFSPTLAVGTFSWFIIKMGKIYQITVVGIQGEKKTVDVATTEDGFNNTTVLEFKKKLVEKLPGNIGNYCVDFHHFMFLCQQITTQE